MSRRLDVQEQRKIRQKITEKHKSKKQERGGRIVVWPAVAATNRRAEKEREEKKGKAEKE